MPQIIIDLNEEDYKKIKKTINYNKKNDLDNESFSGTEIRIEMSPFGNFLQIKGYSECEIQNVGILFKKGSD